jgi:FAD-dependent urate hydroxylase
MSNDRAVDFAVVGAGPYGLAVASHLLALGRPVRVFGKAMEFWDRRMPKGMLLRSPWEGSNIGDPEDALTLDRYAADRQFARPKLLPLDEFVRYGQWFQAKAVPNLDERNVATVDRTVAGFRLTLEDGEPVDAQRVVIAAGIGSFANRPEPFASLPAELASHTCDPVNRDLGRFRGRHVTIIGAGQSALESAALLREAGSEVELLVREPSIRWLSPSGFLEAMMNWKIYPLKAPGKIGPIGVNWLIEHPHLFTSFPRRLQEKMTRRAMRPAGSSWLRPRTEGVRFRTGSQVASAAAAGSKVRLALHDGTALETDHVLLGTGYRVDLSRSTLLAPRMLQAIRTANGYPILGAGFESSVAGLHFVGSTSAHSFGPLCRFVAGTRFTAASLARNLKKVDVRANGKSV